MARRDVLQLADERPYIHPAGDGARQCIAIRKQLTDGGIESLVLGPPDPVREWARHLFADEP